MRWRSFAPCPPRTTRLPPPSSASRLAIAITAALALAGHGCASPGSGIQPGEHVTVYVSMPLRGAEAADGRDVADGARLALAQVHGRVGDLAVRAVYRDDTQARGARPRWSPARAAANVGRVIPSDEVQAQAGAMWAKRLHAKDVIVVGDGSSFAHTIRAAFGAEARTLGLMTGGSRLPGPSAKCGVSASLGEQTTYYAGQRAPTP